MVVDIRLYLPPFNCERLSFFQSTLFQTPLAGILQLVQSVLLSKPLRAECIAEQPRWNAMIGFASYSCRTDWFSFSSCFCLLVHALNNLSSTSRRLLSDSTVIYSAIAGKTALHVLLPYIGVASLISLFFISFTNNWRKLGRHTINCWTKSWCSVRSRWWFSNIHRD